MTTSLSCQWRWFPLWGWAHKLTKQDEEKAKTTKTKSTFHISVKDVERFLPFQRSFPSTEDAETSDYVLHLFFPGPVSLLFWKPLRGLSVPLLLQFHVLKEVSLNQTARGVRALEVLFCACQVPHCGKGDRLFSESMAERGRKRQLPGYSKGRSGGHGVTERHPSMAGCLVSCEDFPAKAGQREKTTWYLLEKVGSVVHQMLHKKWWIIDDVCILTFSHLFLPRETQTWFDSNTRGSFLALWSVLQTR